MKVIARDADRLHGLFVEGVSARLDDDELRRIVTRSMQTKRQQIADRAPQPPPP